MRRAFLALGAAALLVLAPHLPVAQESPVPRPGPVETEPLPPPGGAPQSAPPARSGQGSGGVTLTQEPPAPSVTPPAATPAPPASARPTLLPTPGDPLDVREVTLPAKPTVVLPGESTWDEGFDNLKNAFAKIGSEIARAGLRPAGRPVAVFVETDDAGFRFEAMVPIDKAPEGNAQLPSEMRVGQTPEGRAYHFMHKGPYENIDSTYETITAYLDAKNITAKDVFIEEYVTDLTDNTDDNLEINIFVQPR